MRAKWVIPFLLLAGLLLVALSLPQQEDNVMIQASQDASGSLEEKIDAVLEDERLDGAVTGVSVRHAGTGEPLYEENGDTRLHPASTMKLLTGAAAMETLGPNHRFSTEVWTDGKISGKMLHGNIYLKGKGDPTLLNADLDQFAKELKKQGIERIKGDLIGDDTWYDDIRLSRISIGRMSRSTPARKSPPSPSHRTPIMMPAP